MLVCFIVLNEPANKKKQQFNITWWRQETHNPIKPKQKIRTKHFQNEHTHTHTVTITIINWNKFAIPAKENNSNGITWLNWGIRTDQHQPNALHKTLSKVLMAILECQSTITTKNTEQKHLRDNDRIAVLRENWNNLRQSSDYDWKV